MPAFHYIYVINAFAPILSPHESLFEHHVLINSVLYIYIFFFVYSNVNCLKSLKSIRKMSTYDCILSELFMSNIAIIV